MNDMNVLLENTINTDCKTWEEMQNEGKIIHSHLCLIRLPHSNQSGLYQLVLNEKELWFGTLKEINAIVKSMILLNMIMLQI